MPKDSSTGKSSNPGNVQLKLLPASTLKTVPRKSVPKDAIQGYIYTYQQALPETAYWPKCVFALIQGRTYVKILWIVKFKSDLHFRIHSGFYVLNF